MILLLGLNLQAQIYPVSANLQVTPPFPLGLADYSGSTDKLSLQLLNKDPLTTQVTAYVALKLEAPGITLQTRSTYRPGTPFNLIIGTPLLLNGTDLRELFDPDNMDFAGYSLSAYRQNGNRLPEGIWKLTLQAFDFHTRLPVSNQAFVMMQAFRHPPPLLNWPEENAIVPASFPQYITFQWTPRHTGSLNGLQAQYKFRLAEIQPAGRQPNEVLKSVSPPLYETLTDQTMLVFGPALPQLIEGRSYAWQIQAIDPNGTDAFENQGYSQARAFTWAPPCPVPGNAGLQLSPGGLLLTWQPDAMHSAFWVEFRKKDEPVWKQEKVSVANWQSSSLQKNTEYQVRLYGVCPLGISDKTAILNLRTGGSSSEWDTWADQNCGKPRPKADLSNTAPLGTLQTGDTATAYDFPLYITHIDENHGNGYFTGSALTRTPFTGKIPVPCTFEKARFNADRKLIDGHIKIVETPLEISNRTVERLGEKWREYFGENWNRWQTYSYSAPISKVQKDSWGRIRIFGAGGEESLSGGKNIVIADENGVEWFVSAGGAISPAEGKKTTPVVPDLRGGQGTPTSIPGGLPRIHFHAPVENGYDGSEIQKITAGRLYDELKCSDTLYTVGWKLLQTGRYDSVYASFHPGKKPTVQPDSVLFLRSDGTVLKSRRTGPGSWVVYLSGRLHLQADALWAMAWRNVTGNPARVREVLGKINLITVDVKRVVISLVQANGQSVKQDTVSLSASLREILRPYGVYPVLQISKDLQVKGYDPEKDKITISRSAWRTAYGSDLNRFINAWQSTHPWQKNRPATDTAWFFITGAAAGGESGYMGLGNPYGFLFAGGTEPAPYTIAHELCHGLFGLEHSFGEDPSRAGNSQNLMDYAPPFSLLHALQWKQIHEGCNLKEQLQQTSQTSSRGKLAVVQNVELLKPYAVNGYLTFLAPSGIPFSLPVDGLTKLAFNQPGDTYGKAGGNSLFETNAYGTLHEFVLKDTNYLAWGIDLGNTQTRFTGFYTAKGHRYTDTTSHKNNWKFLLAGMPCIQGGEMLYKVYDCAYLQPGKISIDKINTAAGNELAPFFLEAYSKGLDEARMLPATFNVFTEPEQEFLFKYLTVNNLCGPEVLYAMAAAYEIKQNPELLKCMQDLDFRVGMQLAADGLENLNDETISVLRDNASLTHFRKLLKPATRELSGSWYKEAWWFLYRARKLKLMQPRLLTMDSLNVFLKTLNGYNPCKTCILRMLDRASRKSLLLHFAITGKESSWVVDLLSTTPAEDQEDVLQFLEKDNYKLFTAIYEFLDENEQTNWVNAASRLILESRTVPESLKADWTKLKTGGKYFNNSPYLIIGKTITFIQSGGHFLSEFRGEWNKSNGQVSITSEILHLFHFKHEYTTGAFQYVRVRFTSDFRFLLPNSAKIRHDSEAILPVVFVYQLLRDQASVERTAALRIGVAAGIALFSGFTATEVSALLVADLVVTGGDIVITANEDRIQSSGTPEQKECLEVFQTLTGYYFGARIGGDLLRIATDKHSVQALISKVAEGGKRTGESISKGLFVLESRLSQFSFRNLASAEALQQKLSSVYRTVKLHIHAANAPPEVYARINSAGQWVVEETGYSNTLLGLYNEAGNGELWLSRLRWHDPVSAGSPVSRVVGRYKGIRYESENGAIVEGELEIIQLKNGGFWVREGGWKYSTKIDKSITVVEKESLFGDNAKTFLDGFYRTVLTNEQLVLYRVFGGDARLGGSFATTVSGATREELALLDEWNNTMRFEVKIVIPIKTKLNIGKVGKQTSKDGKQILNGGADQVILPFKWDNSWMKSITDKTTGRIYQNISEFERDFPTLIR
ncbi:MAG: fibronectin type III domain-containing protein [Bacteroidetes bacterium]|nr:fibronectin type III domain-containing protein [Bacteroidota bacterium]